MAGLLFITAALIIASGGRQAPAAAAPEDGGTVCLSDRHFWSGGADEIANIASTPVPQSYRDKFGWSGCRNLDKTSLIEWHLAFGDESSTRAALKWLEANTLPPNLTPERFTRDLANIVARTAPLLNKQPGRAGQEIRALAQAFERYQLMAEAYVRAADFHGSRRLLDAAGRYIPAIDAGVRAFYQDRRVGRAAHMPLSEIAGEYKLNRLRGLQMRYAVANAGIVGSPASLNQAETTVEANYDVALEAAAEAFLHDKKDPCEGEPVPSTLADACGNENNLIDRTASYWYSRAKLDLIHEMQRRARDIPFSSLDKARSIHQSILEHRYGDVGLLYRPEADVLVDLHIARAWSLLRRSRSRAPDDQAFVRAEALNELARADRLVSPALHPGRYRQIATLYLQAFDEARTHDDLVSMDPVHARLAAQFLQNLRSLTDIQNARAGLRLDNPIR